MDRGQEKKDWKNELEEIGTAIQGVTGVLVFSVYGLKPESVD